MIRMIRVHTVCPQSPVTVLKNCGVQTNLRFAADHSETLEVFFLLTSVDLDVGPLSSTENIQMIFEISQMTVAPMELGRRGCSLC
jgi:hypothetical protein